MIDFPPIASERLDLIVLTPDFLEASLAGNVQRAEQLLGLSIPSDWYEHQWLMQVRLSQYEQDPTLLPWLLRAVGLRERRLMVGHIGFHTAPGAEYLQNISPGGVELGYTIYPAFRRQGYASEAAAALMRWAHQTYGVARFVVSISPDNLPSLRMAQQFGFQWIGSHVDEEDGLEDIFELVLPDSNGDAQNKEPDE